MLTTCPECSLQISDKAYSCPHCGFPLLESKPIRKYHRRKKMKLPNGFGQITCLKGNHRNPYRAMITLGHTAEGRPICKLLKPVSYFDSYNAAYEALLEYHQNPYDLMRELTLREVYEKWFDETESDRNERTNKYYQSAWKYIGDLSEMRFTEIKIPNIKAALTQENLPKTAKTQIKNLLNQIYDYAVENEIVSQNLSRQTRVKGAKNRSIVQHHISFEPEEMEKFWKNISEYFTRAILIQCYTGFRPGELCDLEMQNIHLDENYIIGGSKTEAGKDRIVPIHPNIRQLVEQQYQIAKEKGSKYLMLNKRDGKLTPAIYRMYFHEICDQLELDKNHKAHDPRKFFVTEAKKYHLDEYAIKRIVGHAITDLTESVYTERGPEWLYSEICKIPVRTQNLQAQE